ncbi:sigma 54-interacting transcriptional regulator [Brevibacillus sp. NRS-1366]|uniref:sigma 54-interacting transcriptional regulator n=1 Tax=Brevibacillus sp. NRS-1366 TaxID=3233899 RepID=UPI003D1DCAA7
MIVWKDILQPIQSIVHHDMTVQEALTILKESHSGVVLVYDEASCIGYLDSDTVLQQLASSLDLSQKIVCKKDILKVPEDHAIEFYHNISLILGVDHKGEITGYNKVQVAVQQLNQLKLQQFNQILNGAGIGIIHTNADFEITFINETAESIFGLPHSFLLTRNYKSLLTIDKNLDEVLAGKQFVSVDCSLNFKYITGNFSPLWVNGQVFGIVHIFFRKEQWEETVQELDFVRSMYEDLQAIYSSSHEQILVVDATGDIIRLSGTFLKDFWMEEYPEQIIGRNIRQFEQDGIFCPNIFDLCVKKGKKLTSIQETVKDRRIWSVATPVFHDEKLEKVVIVSRDITEMNQLQEELQVAQKKSDQYKQELTQLIRKNEQGKQLIYRSRVMENLVDEMKQIAQVDSTVLLNGESGVGKEVFAHAIHESSKRKGKSFVRVNCGAIPESLIESELFGYEKGAFTGADQKGKPGLFELANEGTIFLDEISELPLNMQVKLLRILQEKEITRVGGVKTVSLNVRVVAATNKNLKELVLESKFREDLYYRLNVIPLYIPPLRERIEDIVPLSISFLQQFYQAYQKEKSLSLEAIEVLENYNWPGNVRELHNIIERLIVTTKNDFILRDDVLSVLYGEKRGRTAKPLIFDVIPLKEAVAELESQLIELALKKYGTATKVAEVLEISQATVSRRINKRLK